MKKKNRKQKLHKKGYAALAAGLAVGSVAINSGYSNPNEIINPNNLTAVPLVQNDDDDDDSDIKKNKNTKDKVKNSFNNLPLWFRAGVGVPLWLLGAFIVWIVNGLWQTVLSLSLATIGSWILIILFLFIIELLIAKALFPNIPWKKLLSKNAIKFTLAASVILALIDTIMPVVWPDYKKITTFIKIIGSILILIKATSMIYKLHKVIKYTVSLDNFKVEFEKKANE